VTIVLVPVYKPGPGLSTLLDELPAGMQVVIVDDGSGPAFDSALDIAGADVLRHATNQGKGTALKTGFRHIAAKYPGQDVVCADADGQHSVEDILRVAAHARESDRMVLGVRRFEENVPLRSKVGNTITQVLFRAATGRRVRDTQTGLRAYPAALVGDLPAIPGERFEYEMNVLLHAARTGHSIEQVVITTTYLDDNKSSHFGAVSDSVRIYWPLLRYAFLR
jgi:glycosyltransferase involved in cell wall biosynthesis